jgi:hypothetical protein
MKFLALEEGYIYVIMFPKRSFGNILFYPVSCLSSSPVLFLSGNVLRNYSRDQYETFQDDSLAFINVLNDGHFFF